MGYDIATVQTVQSDEDLLGFHSTVTTPLNHILVITRKPS